MKNHCTFIEPEWILILHNNRIFHIISKPISRVLQSLWKDYATHQMKLAKQ